MAFTRPGMGWEEGWAWMPENVARYGRRGQANKQQPTANVCVCVPGGLPGNLTAAATAVQGVAGPWPMTAEA
jgi:hypothetical protein